MLIWDGAKRVGDRPGGQTTVLLPHEERENGIHWADFLGERVVAVLDSNGFVTGPEDTPLPSYPVLEQEGRLVPVEGLLPSHQRFPTIGVVRLNDGRDVFVWDREGYELRDGHFELVYEFKAKWRSYHDSLLTPFGPDGFFFVSNRQLFSVRRGQSPVRHLSELTNIMHVSAGPPGAVLLKEGNNDLGDVGKLYLIKEDTFIRIEPELFADKDSKVVDILHWSGSSRRLVAATSERFWAVRGETVLALPRHRASSGKELHGSR